MAGCGDGEDGRRDGGPASGTGGGSPVATDAGHARMEALLSGLRERDRTENPFFGSGPVDALRTRADELAAAGAVREHAETLGRLGVALVNHGEIEEGIRTLEECQALYARHRAPGAARAGIAFALGVAFLRLGETENCCVRHSPESCILPLQGDALHVERRGSESALRWFEEVASMPEADPGLRLRAVWLTNLAHMTLGSFPDGVPADLRLPATYLETGGRFPRFRNVATAVGIGGESLAGGVAVEDFDGDGDFDIVRSSWDSSAPLGYLENRGPEGFRERGADAGFEHILGGLNIVQADYDNDGDTDLFILRGAWLGGLGRHPNSLLRNQGGGRFRDATFDAGLAEVHLPSSTAAWADFDNDGDLDLFVGNEGSEAHPAPCQLFRNEGDGTFVDVAADAGVTNDAFTKGATWGDFDNDGWPDLAVSNLSSANRLYHNQKNGSFVDVAARAGVEKPIRSFPLWFWDYDNDGNLDLFICSYTGTAEALVWEAMGNSGLLPEGSRLYRGDGAGGFEDVSEQCGVSSPMLPMGSNFGDLDNDGFPDFYLGTGEPDIAVVVPNRLFRNDGGRRFVDVTMASGLGHLQKGHGVALADFNGDGALDVFEQMGGAYRVDAYRDALYANPGFGNRWLQVRLVGRQANRSAIGARVRVEIEEDGVRRFIHRQVGTGGSFGANPLALHLGLGRAGAVRSLEIVWPASGTRQVLTNIESDRAVEIVEGVGSLRELAADRFAWPAAGR